MTNKKIKYCDNCQKDVVAKVVERQTSYTFKGESFEINERVLVCNDCKVDLYDENLDSETMRILTKMYEERVGLSLEEIKSIRSQYGLSMELFARILGWSKATIVRYESGKYIPDASHMSVLKRLKDHPESIDDYYKRNLHKFSPKEQGKISKKLASKDQSTVVRELMNVLNRDYKLHEKTVESGYRLFDMNKLINMILFFARNGIQKTKLMKLLFYSDFLHYKKNLLSISGVPYVRFPYGPVPKDYDLLLASFEKCGIIEVDKDIINQYMLSNIKAKQKFDDSLFTEGEIAIMEFVEDYFKHYGSVKISAFSHEEDAWKNTEDKKIISYDYADTLNIDFKKPL